MSYGIQIFDSAGTLTFDSDGVMGGVCLGFVTVPATQIVTLTYPEFGPGHTGFILNAFAGPLACDTSFSYDNNLGYPRFSFSGANHTRSVILFIK